MGEKKKKKFKNETAAWGDVGSARVKLISK